MSNRIQKAVREFLGKPESVYKIPGIILFGLPGAGKGTYGRELAKDFKLFKLAPGDLIRSMLNDPSRNDHPISKHIRSLVDGGKLVSNEVVMDMVIQEYEREGRKFRGIIFDGIPRTLAQVRLLQEHFDLSQFSLINVILREDILVEKLAGRRVCDKCGRNYNVCSIQKDGYEMDPLLSKKGEKCEDCDGNLTERTDDKEEIIRERMGVYKKETLPVMDELVKVTSRKVDFEPRRGVKDYPILRKQVERFWEPSKVN